MWARHVEACLATWLMLCPWLLGYAERLGATLHDLALGLLLGAAACLGCWRRTRWVRLLVLPGALWLAGSGWALGVLGEADGLTQNRMILGLLLAMLVFVPSGADSPPSAWTAALEEAETDDARAEADDVRAEASA